MKRLTMILLMMLTLLFAAGCGGEETDIREEKKENVQENQITTAEEIAPSETEYANDLPSAYRSVIEKYRAVKEEGIRAVECRSHDVSVLAVSDDDKGYAVDLGYADIDLDGDGIEELIIAGLDTDSYRKNMIFDLYTLKDGQATRLMIGSQKSRLYLTTSHEIYNMGFYGADKAVDYVYRIEAGELFLVEGFLSRWEREESAIAWFYTRDQDYDFSNDTRINTEEAKERIAAYESSTYLPPLIKID